MSEVIERLRDDSEYYGAFGQQYLSNSNISALLNNPKMFGVRQPDNKAFAFGRLFHQLILEPEKASAFKFVDIKTRTSKAYKEAVEDSGEDFLLLKKEVEWAEYLADTVVSNIELYDMIYAEGNEFERPSVTKIQGIPFKGKADIVTNTHILDLKTTGDISKFKWSAKNYNYDSQAYVYGLLFNRPMVFIVIDKTSRQMGVYRATDSFVESGKEKVERALKVYNKFFSKEATESVDNYFIEQNLY